MDSLESNSKFYFWNSAALCGLCMGVVLSLGAILSYVYKNHAENINNISIITAFVVVTYILGKRYVKGMGDKYVGYGKALGYILSSMIFAGVVYGVAVYVLYTYDPAYFRGLQQAVLESAKVSDATMTKMNEGYDMFLNSPMIAILSSILSMIVYGIFPALITAALIRKRG